MGPTRAVRSKLGTVAEIPFEGRRSGRSEGSFDCVAASHSRSCYSAQDDRRARLANQLPSLLARFHEINSPIVELVLETGCL